MKTAKRLLPVVAFALAACGPEPADQCSNPDGFLINNVRLLDGSGAPAVSEDVRVSGGLIAATGNLTVCAGESVVDGGGLTLAPGFIDTHSHGDRGIDELTDALNSVSQGITTAVVGQDGGSPYPLADFYAALEANPPTINFASYVGHNTLRNRVMGEDNKRAATDSEILEMADLLVQELDAGALGFGTGLEYEPGIYSATAEVITLGEIAANAGTRYISHLRSEDRWLEDAIDEIILIGRETGMPVQISHFKLAMTPLWGRATELLAKLDAARADGIDITADVYPYEYWQSTMMVLLPDRDYTNRETIANVLEEIAPADGMWFTRYEPQPEYVGKTLVEVADILETDTVTAFSELARMAVEWQEEHGERAEMIIGTSMHPDDVTALIAWEHSNISSDGGLTDLHPRGAGSFPRVLGRYVREQGRLSLENAVHKMSGMSAAHMGITDRGLIQEGLAADLVLFDPDTVIDNATPEDPMAISSGIESVWVNGELVFANGAVTNARPGKALRRQ